jgi:ribosomal-protein-alanine N-acetyltransferase
MSAVLKPQPALRTMLPADIDSVMAIENAIYEFPWTPGNFRDSLAAGYNCWVFAQDREVIGYAIVTAAAGEAHLLNLSIAARWQRKGYGGSLLKQLMTATRANGAAVMFLEVRQSNFAAQGLYAQHGFAHIGLRRNYYPASDGREHAIVLSRSL